MPPRRNRKGHLARCRVALFVCTSAPWPHRPSWRLTGCTPRQRVITHAPRAAASPRTPLAPCRILGYSSGCQVTTPRDTGERRGASMNTIGALAQELNISALDVEVIVDQIIAIDGHEAVIAREIPIHNGSNRLIGYEVVLTDEAAEAVREAAEALREQLA